MHETPAFVEGQFTQLTIAIGRSFTLLSSLVTQDMKSNVTIEPRIALLFRSHCLSLKYLGLFNYIYEFYHELSRSSDKQVHIYLRWL